PLSAVSSGHARHHKRRGRPRGNPKRPSGKGGCGGSIPAMPKSTAVEPKQEETRTQVGLNPGPATNETLTSGGSQFRFNRGPDTRFAEINGDGSEIGENSGVQPTISNTPGSRYSDHLACLSRV